MKALSLTQPWATLVALGAKKIETRSWSHPYRGWLAIHAAKGLDPVGGAEGLILQCQQEPFHSVLREHFGTPFTPAQVLPLGAIVAVASLYHVGKIARNREGAVYIDPKDWTVSSEQELAFGDYTPGRYGWVLTNVHQLKEPIPCRGALGVWDVPAEIERQLPEVYRGR